jgi:putative transposase
MPSSGSVFGRRQQTPNERHAGQDAVLLEKRVGVYEAAKAKHPQRWSGSTRNWQPVQVVHLNPDQQKSSTPRRKEIQTTLKKVA